MATSHSNTIEFSPLCYGCCFGLVVLLFAIHIVCKRCIKSLKLNTATAHLFTSRMCINRDVMIMNASMLRRPHCIAHSICNHVVCVRSSVVFFLSLFISNNNMKQIIRYTYSIICTFSLDQLVLNDALTECNSAE